MVIGEDEVFARLRAARPGIACTTPPTAALAALKALGARRIAVLTPYTEGVNRRVRDYFTGRGLAIAAFGAFDKESDVEIAAIAPASIVAAARALDAPDIEAIFLSCTGMRGLAVVEELEARLGKPVITSNQAMAWHALRLAGYDAPLAGFGRLLQV
jgi:maleate isomerase